MFWIYHEHLSIFFGVWLATLHTRAARVQSSLCITAFSLRGTVKGVFLVFATVPHLPRVFLAT